MTHVAVQKHHIAMAKIDEVNDPSGEKKGDKKPSTTQKIHLLKNTHVRSLKAEQQTSESVKRICARSRDFVCRILRRIGASYIHCRPFSQTFNGNGARVLS